MWALKRGRVDQKGDRDGESRSGREERIGLPGVLVALVRDTDLSFDGAGAHHVEAMSEHSEAHFERLTSQIERLTVALRTSRRIGIAVGIMINAPGSPLSELSPRLRTKVDARSGGWSRWPTTSFGPGCFRMTILDTPVTWLRGVWSHGSTSRCLYVKSRNDRRPTAPWCDRTRAHRHQCAHAASMRVCVRIACYIASARIVCGHLPGSEAGFGSCRCGGLEEIRLRDPTRTVFAERPRQVRRSCRSRISLMARPSKYVSCRWLPRPWFVAGRARWRTSFS